MGAELTPHGAPVGRRRAQLAVVVVGDHISCLGVRQVAPSWKEPGDGEGVGGTRGKMVRVQRAPSGPRAGPHQEPIMSSHVQRRQVVGGAGVEARIEDIVLVA